ncbi:hypothetical protein FHT87_002432 [Rhizobium sp. BK316]|uniref:hypothetical protein n=1 Tax=Rhizobium sp. BK316 TaxID=2587053 RepID=UPI00161E0089|nr:hypothetical protein [Rhizobium sp. BK316]MBB3408529.1 hypothetical protein [Rhizobium sp. BK316]
MALSQEQHAPSFDKHFMIGDQGAIWQLKGNSPVELVEEATPSEIQEFRMVWETYYDHDDTEFSTRLAVRSVYVGRLRHIESLTEKLGEYRKELDESIDEIKALEEQNRILLRGISEAVKILVPEGAAHV